MIVCLNKSDLRTKLTVLTVQHLWVCSNNGGTSFGTSTLIKRALSENDKVVVSIFVNPTQFDNYNDLEAYPRTLDNDMSKLDNLSEDIVVYAPGVADIYPEELLQNTLVLMV